MEEVPCVAVAATVEQVEERGYLLANPDVQGISAAEHFRQEPGRVQWVNLDAVAALRARKLARLRFRHKPLPGPPGGPADFMTPALREEFGIPAHPRVSAHVYDSSLLRDIRETPEKLYLDIGAGLRPSVCGNLVNVDIHPWISTDVVCVAEDLPFADAQFDFVMCLAVLEHTRRPWEAAAEICRVLKPGGTALIAYPFLIGVHGYPSHYFNATPNGAISLFERECDIVSSEITHNFHPIQTLWHALDAFTHGLPEPTRSRLESMRVSDILARPPEAQLTEDYCIELNDETRHRIAAGSTLVVRRKITPPAVAPRERIAALEQELVAMRGSTSWRVTAPLRALARRLRGR